MDDRVKNIREFIRASRIVVEPGCMPSRVVLYLGRPAFPSLPHSRPEWVVHTERLVAVPAAEGTSCAFRHQGFDHGDYVDSLEAAERRFEERARKL